MNSPSCIPPRSRTPRSAFTLIELLTVIAIIGILAAILIPTVGKVRASARKVQCVSNERQIALACLSYAYENKGRLPATDRSVTPNVRWMFQVAPYLGRTGGDPNQFNTGKITSAFQCPSDPDRVAAFAVYTDANAWDSVSYLHMSPFPLTARENGLIQKQLSQVSDHSMHPMLVCARITTSAFYQNNAEFEKNVKSTTGFIHEDGANVAYYDGSAKYKKNPTWTSTRGFPDVP